jgi:PmbA protein
MGAAQSLLVLAEQAVALARRKGANEVSASAYQEREVETVWRDGKIEKVSEATTRGLGLRLYVDGRYSAASTSDLRPDALDAFVEEAVAMTRSLVADPFRGLPDPRLYQGRATLDLAIDDPKHEEVTADSRRRAARELEEAARAAPGADAIVSVTTRVFDSRAFQAKVTSNGFSGAMQSTYFGTDAEVTCKDEGGRRPEASDGAHVRALADLRPAAEVGRGATERARARLGARKIASGVVPLVVENRAARRLVGAILGALTGRALQQKQSFLEGKLGEAVGSARFELVDDPLLPRGLGSRLYDSDGISAKRRSVFEKGVLKTFFIDDYYGRKLGKAPTTGSSSNLLFAGGAKSAAEIVAEARDGVLVTGFLGGNSNATTGEYSLGIEGFAIRAGAVAEPIGEMNISGNLGELWKKLAVTGNDPWPYASIRTPTLLFDGVQVAGL